MWEYENLFHELLEPNSSDSNFTRSSVSSLKPVMERNPILKKRNFLLNGTWFCIDKQQERKKEMLYHFFSILIEIALLCQKKDSYTDSVYSHPRYTIEDLTKMKSQ